MSRRTLVLLGMLCALLVAVVAVAVLSAGDDSAEPERDPTPSTEATTTTVEPTTEVEGTPGAAGVGDPYFPGLGNGGYDVQHYELELTWLADSGRLEGVASIDAVATQDLSRFNLDLSGMEVTAVTVDGAAAISERSERELVVSPAEVIPSGDPFVVAVTYAGTPEPIPVGTDLFRVGWQTDGREAFVVSEPAGAATFFPANDHPSDKATYTFEITAPEDQVVAANGVLQGEPLAGVGTRTWTYEADSPMASYLVQVAIGDYVLEDAGEAAGVPLRHSLHRSFLAQARDTVARTGEMVELLSEAFGPYPFDVYGVLAVDEPLGFALETQTLTIIGSDVATRGRGSDQILLHELAHQWVGNSVSPATWKDIWLNEGFASYAEWLWTERIGGPSAGDTARRVAANARGLDVPPGDPGVTELFQPTVYLRGAMTLQALREAIGDADFFELLRQWVDRHEGDVASTEDLVALSEEISGQQLDALFQEWLYAEGLPAFG